MGGGHRLRDRLDALVDARELGDVGQLLVDDLLAQVGQVDVDEVLAADAAARADLRHDRAADHVARREIEQCRRVALHETLARVVAQVSALAARRLGEQDAEPAMPVGWNWKNSMSSSGTPWRYASATPSPVSEKAFDVIRNMRPKPPVANITAAARKTCNWPSAIR